MPRLPIPSDPFALHERLLGEERELSLRIAELEEQIRKFESDERPRYQNWLRVELGPRFAEFDVLVEEVRAKHFLLRRVEELVERLGLHPREALFVATVPREPAPEAEASPKSGAKPDVPDLDESAPPGSSGKPWNAEEIEARRQAKKDAKRADKKEKKRQKAAERPNAGATPAPDLQNDSARKRLVSFYRALARKLHPDAAHGAAAPIDAEKARKLWLEVQAAYEAGDSERLMTIAAWLNSDEDESALAAGRPAPGSSFSPRFERLRLLERARRKREREFLRLAEHPAWGFLGLRGNDKRKLRSRAARELDEEIRRAQEAFAELEDAIDSIGPPRPPRPR